MLSTTTPCPSTRSRPSSRRLPMTPRELANKLLDFYQNDPKRWTQRTFARDASGLSAHPLEKQACSFLALGAARVMGVDNWSEVGDDLASKFGYYSLSNLNDECKSFEEFTSMLREIA